MTGNSSEKVDIFGTAAQISIYNQPFLKTSEFGQKVNVEDRLNPEGFLKYQEKVWFAVVRKDEKTEKEKKYFYCLIDGEEPEEVADIINSLNWNGARKTIHCEIKDTEDLLKDYNLKVIAINANDVPSNLPFIVFGREIEVDPSEYNSNQQREVVFIEKYTKALKEFMTKFVEERGILPKDSIAMKKQSISEANEINSLGEHLPIPKPTELNF